MSAKERQRTVFIQKRAHALAMMLLTRRADLLIEEAKDDIGLDYIVRFHTAGKEGLREFGVELRGVWAAVTKEHADNVLRRSLRETKGYGPFLRPVCLFFFTMEDDGAWYTWIAEPVVAEDGKPRLCASDHADCRPLDNRSLKDVLEQVDSWYDAVLPVLVTNGPEGGKVDRKRMKQ
jgi:hypothetical protein